MALTYKKLNWIFLFFLFPFGRLDDTPLSQESPEKTQDYYIFLNMVYQYVNYNRDEYYTKEYIYLYIYNKKNNINKYPF